MIVPDATPLISVIITAYDRKEYLRQAVDSALKQTLPRHRYEVILSKNFETEYDEEWLEKGVKLIRFKQGYVGSQIADALEHCEGRIIAFLDDDDWWEPVKLEHVEKVWAKHPNTAYYHHSMIFEFEKTGDQAWRRTMDKFSRNWVRTPWYNNSSTVIAKEVLEAKLEHLKKLSLALDLFCYFATLTVGGQTKFDDARLTHYRVPTTQRRGRIYQKDRLLIRDMIAESGNKALLRYYEQTVICGRMYLNLIERLNGGRRVSPKEFLAYTTHCAAHRPQNMIKWFILGVGLLSPRLASQAHYLIDQARSGWDNPW